MSDLAPSAAPEPCAASPASRPALEILPGRLTDLQGLAIRRLLPRSGRRLVGPWCFLDSYGPLSFSGGKPMDVAPHPHVGLQTVSWLLEGEVVHHDSLGRVGPAVPGVLNLMTAGRGIAHSEETPPRNSGRLRGIQLWVALPEAHRNTAPDFAQHHALPEEPLVGGRARVLMGRMGSAVSPARTFSPLVGAHVIGWERRVVVPLETAFEHALVLLAGSCALEDRALPVDGLVYLGGGRSEIVLVSEGRFEALLLGGAPFGETVLMWWNFVGRTADDIASARGDWEAGRRFGEVRGYDGPPIPAPPLVARPVPH